MHKNLGDRSLDPMRCLEKVFRKQTLSLLFVPSPNLFSSINTDTVFNLRGRVPRGVRPTCSACGVPTVCKNREQSGEFHIKEISSVRKKAFENRCISKNGLECLYSSGYHTTFSKARLLPNT